MSLGYVESTEGPQFFGPRIDYAGSKYFIRLCLVVPLEKNCKTKNKFNKNQKKYSIFFVSVRKYVFTVISS
jgi:hypothetical protein